MVSVSTNTTDLCLGLVDRLDLLSYRPQPFGRRQVHDYIEMGPHKNRLLWVIMIPWFAWKEVFAGE